MDPAIFVMLTACSMGFFALLVAMRDEEAARPRILLEDNPFDLVDAAPET
jgi:hypothetical protein